MCEEAEIKSVFSDCGFYTPDGARDQWAIEAWANPDYQRSHCPEHVITGKPFYETVVNSYFLFCFSDCKLLDLERTNFMAAQKD